MPTSSNQPVLEILGLTRAYGDRLALDRLSLELHRGEILGLLGPNGAGKTTAFSLLTGLLAPDEGEIRLDGNPVGLSQRRYRQRLGVIFQEPSLDRKLSARENLSLHAALHGLADAAGPIEELLGFFELSDRAEEPVEQFSGGMRRRLDLARVLLHKPSILLLDEPTGGLDESTFRAVWQRIEDLCESQGCSAIVTTHRPAEAARCHRLAILDEGRIIATGTPEELTASVDGDVVILQTSEGEALAPEIETHFGLGSVVTDTGLRIECKDGHTLIPRLVETLPSESIRSVSLHRPDLADAFYKLAGRSLESNP